MPKQSLNSWSNAVSMFVQAMMIRLEQSKEMEAAEKLKLEEEIRAKQEEVQKIQEEVNVKDAETRRLQVCFTPYLYIIFLNNNPAFQFLCIFLFPQRMSGLIIGIVLS